MLTCNVELHFPDIRVCTHCIMMKGLVTWPQPRAQKAFKILMLFYHSFLILIVNHRHPDHFERNDLNLTILHHSSTKKILSYQIWTFTISICITLSLHEQLFFGKFCNACKLRASQFPQRKCIYGKWINKMYQVHNAHARSKSTSNNSKIAHYPQILVT